jgi:hypothetical protein
LKLLHKSWPFTGHNKIPHPVVVTITDTQVGSPAGQCISTAALHPQRQHARPRPEHG